MITMRWAHFLILQVSTLLDYHRCMLREGIRKIIHSPFSSQWPSVELVLAPHVTGSPIRHWPELEQTSRYTLTFTPITESHPWSYILKQRAVSGTITIIKTLQAYYMCATAKSVTVSLQYNPFTGEWTVSRSDDPKQKGKICQDPVLDTTETLAAASIN